MQNNAVMHLCDGRLRWDEGLLQQGPAEMSRSWPLALSQCVHISIVHQTVKQAEQLGGVKTCAPLRAISRLTRRS